jgi:hypothetical protein
MHVQFPDDAPLTSMDLHVECAVGQSQVSQVDDFRDRKGNHMEMSAAAQE